MDVMKVESENIREVLRTSERTGDDFPTMKSLEK